MHNKNICNSYLSDKEYLQHMIDHHQVAVDMAEKLKTVSYMPFMLEIARNISYTQTYEIWIMKMMFDGGIPNISLFDKKFKIWNPKYLTKCYYPNMAIDKNAKCEHHFFIPDKKMLMHINNKNFLEHMIPHHQVAIDMSHRLLLHTKNPNLLEFANHIIHNQQDEIWNMKEILKNNGLQYQFNSPLFEQK